MAKFAQQAPALATRPAARSGFVRCRVAGPSNVAADGYTIDGNARASWAPGDVGDFLATDVASVAGALVAAE